MTCKMMKKAQPFSLATGGFLDMTVEGLGGMFEGYSAEMRGVEIPLVQMGG